MGSNGHANGDAMQRPSSTNGAIRAVASEPRTAKAKAAEQGTVSTFPVFSLIFRLWIRSYPHIARLMQELRTSSLQLRECPDVNVVVRLLQCSSLRVGGAFLYLSFISAVRGFRFLSG